MSKNMSYPTGPNHPRLLNEFRKLSEPANYYQGITHHALGLPNNILLFGRVSGANLNTPRSRSFHHRHLLLVPLIAQGRVIVDGTAHSLEPGTALLIHPYQFHHYSNLPVGNLAWLFLTFDQPETKQTDASVSSIQTSSFWPDLFELMICYQKPQEGSYARIIALRLALLLEHLRKSSSSLDNTLTANLRPDEAFVLQVHLLIKQTLSHPLSLQTMASQLGFSESHLRTKFRTATGQSLGDYQRRVRLQHAAKLLYQQNLPVNEVASACGWESPFTFSRAFSQFWGMAPRDFRKVRRP